MDKFIFNKKKLGFALLVTASVISIIWIFLKFNKTNQVKLPTPAPVKFELVKTIPASGIGAKIIPTSAIEFVFSKPIDINSLVINIDSLPNFTFEISEDQKTLYLKLVPTWELNKLYNISLDVKSQTGEPLPEKINYQLKIISLEDSNLIEQFNKPQP